MDDWNPAHVVFASYDHQHSPGPGGVRPHQTRIALIVADDEGDLSLQQRVDRLLDGCEEERARRTEVLMAGEPAIRVDYRSGVDKVAALVADVAGAQVAAVCFGDSAPFDDIVRTLRPLSDAPA